MCSISFCESSECVKGIPWVMNAYQLGAVSDHHITAWRGSIITVLAAKFKKLTGMERWLEGDIYRVCLLLHLNKLCYC